MQMNTMKKASLEKFLTRNGGVILCSKRDLAAGETIESYTFFVKKENSAR